MRIVQCHGCFDLLHLGHIRHFQAAKAYGDKLIVTVTPDRFVNKGAGRPVFTEAQRIEAISALACVDEVRSSGDRTAEKSIREIRPSVFAKGPDYSAATLDPAEAQALADVGAELVITETEKWSSTALIPQTDPVRTYLAGIRAKYSASDVLGWLDKCRALKVLVIGDAIQDEYHYVECLGKSGKDPILASRFIRAETFVGGAEAVAQHVGACADDVSCVTGNPIIKRRFVESYPFQKMFEVYVMPETQAQPSLAGVADADVVIVADYGHGFLGAHEVAVLTDKAKFLAVNVQANAGNHGFNTISKYRRANFVSLSERELRLEYRNQEGKLPALLYRLAQRCETDVLVTRGEKGGLAVTPDGEYKHAPAMTTHAVDRTGAGDAVFAITACLAAVGTPLDLLTFIASLVGSQAVGIVGNARYIERASLRAAIEQVWA